MLPISSPSTGSGTSTIPQGQENLNKVTDEIRTNNFEQLETNAVTAVNEPPEVGATKSGKSSIDDLTAFLVNSTQPLISQAKDAIGKAQQAVASYQKNLDATTTTSARSQGAANTQNSVDAIA